MKRAQMPDGLDAILRLRRVEHMVDAEVLDEVVAVREYLEDLVGPTVRPADAARLLGIAQPSLNHWLDKGDVPTVLTPEGRREIPLTELLHLLDEVANVRGKVDRPLTRVMRDRRRRASEAVDLDRLLPRRKGRDHRTAELQSLAYHRLVAERLDDAMVAGARRKIRRWRREGRIHPRWADEWDTVLSLPPARIARAISADSARGRELRQTSPFAGLLTEQERRRLVKAVEERAAS